MYCKCSIVDAYKNCDGKKLWRYTDLDGWQFSWRTWKSSNKGRHRASYFVFDEDEDCL